MKRVTAEKVNVFKGFRAFEKTRSGKCLHAPKPGALPTALHPDMMLGRFSEASCNIISARGGFVKRFMKSKGVREKREGGCEALS